MTAKFFLLAFASAMVTATTAVGQIVPANTTFFSLDFSANDQLVSAPQPNTLDPNMTPEDPSDDVANPDAGLFTTPAVSQGPFVDGELYGQQGIAGNGTGRWTVDTAAGTANQPEVTGSFLLGNIFKGQPLIAVGDVVRLETDISFTKPLVNGAETNSGPFFFFGFRGGEGGGEFQPNDGISQAVAYNLGADGAAVDPTDSNVQARLVANGTSATETTFGNVLDAGMDFANSDFTTDVLTIRSDAEFTVDDANSGATFVVTTSLFNGSTQLGDSVVSTATDTGITLAGNRIQFAFRDGAAGATDVNLHRLAAIFNPDDSAVLEGDFDNDGTVDVDDLDAYIGNIGMSPAGELAALDLDDDNDIDADDFTRHYSQLVETSNGEKGTFQGDANLDGTVDVLGDAAALINNLGASSNTSWAQGDFNADGIVDVLGDAAILINNLGNSNTAAAAPATSAVPEPGSLSLLALAGLTAVARRRR